MLNILKSALQYKITQADILSLLVWFTVNTRDGQGAFLKVSKTGVHVPTVVAI
jgi:hypothetical protein